MIKLNVQPVMFAPENCPACTDDEKLVELVVLAKTCVDDFSICGVTFGKSGRGTLGALTLVAEAVIDTGLAKI